MSSLNISPQAHIASQSVILGDVTIGADSSVFYYAVVRGDEASITIGRRSNIQDNSTVHVDYGFPTIIGDDVTVGHNCVIHGCTIGYTGRRRSWTSDTKKPLPPHRAESD